MATPASTMANQLKGSFVTSFTRGLVTPKGISGTPFRVLPSSGRSTFTVKAVQSEKSKDKTECRPRGGGSTSSHGGRSGTDRYAEQDVPSVVIPNHLQVQSAECSHVSFGSIGATMNLGFSESFGSRPLSKVEDEHAEAHIPFARPSETRNYEYYGDESIITSDSNLRNRTRCH